MCSTKRLSRRLKDWKTSWNSVVCMHMKSPQQFIHPLQLPIILVLGLWLLCCLLPTLVGPKWLHCRLADMKLIRRHSGRKEGLFRLLSLCCCCCWMSQPLSFSDAEVWPCDKDFSWEVDVLGEAERGKEEMPKKEKLWFLHPLSSFSNLVMASPYFLSLAKLQLLLLFPLKTLSAPPPPLFPIL